MKTFKDILTESVEAAVDIPAYRFVAPDGNLCGANAKALGASKAATKTGQQCPVMILGVAIIETGGAVTAQQEVTSDSLGRAVTVGNVGVSSVIALDIDTTVTPTVGVSVPAGEVPVLSSAAQPDLVESASCEAVSTGTASAVNTVSGGALPLKINGMALDSADGAGEFIRVVLK